MKRKTNGLLFPIYLLTLALFINTALMKTPFDVVAIAIGIIMCLITWYAHFVVRRFFPEGDRFIVSFISILPTIGIAMIYRLNSGEGIKQIMWFVAGMSLYCLVVIVLPNLSKFAKLKYFYLFCTIVLVAMATFIGVQKNGAKNWVMIPGTGFGIQPSELGKVFYTLYLASALKDYRNFKSLIEPGAVVAVTMVFMLLQADLGSALLYAGIALAMLYVATQKLTYIGASFVVGGIGSVAAYKMFNHLRQRIALWRNPFKYESTIGYQTVQGFYAMASGGILGSGLFNGAPTLVPVVSTDFIFVAIVEELGFITGVGILIIYALLFLRCIRIALNVRSIFSSLLAVGFSVMIALQVFVIVGGILNVIPLTGITLPLISYGGSSMLSIFFALGIIQKTSEEEVA